MSDANRIRVRCRATRRDGTACQGPATSTGYCIAHDPRASQWRVMGGHASRRSERAIKLLPARLYPSVTLLEKALDELYHGRMTVKLGTAMAAVASVLVRVLQSADLGERVHDLEQQVRELRTSQGGAVQEEGQRWTA